MDPGPEILALVRLEGIAAAEVGNHLVDVGEVGEEEVGGSHALNKFYRSRGNLR